MAKRKPSQSSQDAFPGVQPAGTTKDTSQAASPPIPAAQPASGTPQELPQEQGQETGQETPHEQEKKQGPGNVPALSAPGGTIQPDAVSSPARDYLAIYDRLKADGRWSGLGLGVLRDDMMRECRRVKGMTKEAAQAWTYAELDRMYPPLVPHNNKGQIALFPSGGEPSKPLENPASPQLADSGPKGGIVGLGDVPAGWPALPGNTSLAAEIGWVQANRLYVVEEQPGKATQVRLERAHEPAPSRAAIGWLETSIRSYAKFVEVAAKTSGTEDDEQAFVKRERASIEEIRALLQEMMAAAKG